MDEEAEKRHVVKKVNCWSARIVAAVIKLGDKTKPDPRLFCLGMLDAAARLWVIFHQAHAAAERGVEFAPADAELDLESAVELFRVSLGYHVERHDKR